MILTFTITKKSKTTLSLNIKIKEQQYFVGNDAAKELVKKTINSSVNTMNNHCTKGLGCAMLSNATQTEVISKTDVKQPNTPVLTNKPTLTSVPPLKSVIPSTSGTPNVQITPTEKLVLPSFLTAPPQTEKQFKVDHTKDICNNLGVTIPNNNNAAPLPSEVMLASALPAKSLTQNKASENPIDFTAEKEQAPVTNTVPQPAHASKTLLNANNQFYSTTITAQTNSEDISDEDLLKGLLDRGLLKKANDSKKEGDFKVVPIELQNGETFLLNQTKHKVKLSSLGQAYNEKLPPKEYNIKTDDAFAQNIDDMKYFIIAPPSVTDECLIETGIHKHMIVTFDTVTGEYYAAGYLTSKNSGFNLSVPQYKAFETCKNNEAEIFLSGKPQNLKAFKNPTKINQEDIKIVKYSEEYIAQFSKDDIDSIKDIIKKQKETGYTTNIDKQGLTKDMALEICKQHDVVAEELTKLYKINKNTNNNIKPKIQHPLNEDQKEKNNKNNKKIENTNKQQEEPNITKVKPIPNENPF